MNKTYLVIMVLLVAGALGYTYFKGNKYTNPEPVQNISTQPAEPAPVENQSSPSNSVGTAMTQEETLVKVSAAGFEPKTLNVKVGTKVTWKNEGGKTVNVASAVHPTHLVYPPLNLGEVGDGASVSLVFTDVGSFNYHDHLTPTHTGTIVVE